jgi:hypothetical protein
MISVQEFISVICQKINILHEPSNCLFIRDEHLGILHELVNRLT